MIYRDFKGLKLSALGFGAMRLPTGSSDGDINEAETEKMIDKSIFNNVIVVPETISYLSPIVSIIPLQLLAYYVSKEKGLDVDKPRNLAKSVTVE